MKSPKTSDKGKKRVEIGKYSTSITCTNKQSLFDSALQYTQL